MPRVEMRGSVAADIRSIFTCPDLASARARLKERAGFYSKSAPKLATWMEENLPQGFVLYALPEAHRKRMRTSNAIERGQSGTPTPPIRPIRLRSGHPRRSGPAAPASPRCSPNEAALLRLATALLCEMSDECLTGKFCLNMNSADPPQT